MNDQNILFMAREAGLVRKDRDPREGSLIHLERFAALVSAQAAAQERERCAQVAARREAVLAQYLTPGLAADYFTRGAESASGRIAAAIRAMGDKP